ncbi:hypothetical protein JCM24511_08957 [Saitozyma sp. JCM 24511]|nr:hypothetical protein JCM24511_08957 [Saitozyma sp. JCM 24511]
MNLQFPSLGELEEALPPDVIETLMLCFQRALPFAADSRGEYDRLHGLKRCRPQRSVHSQGTQYTFKVTSRPDRSRTWTSPTWLAFMDAVCPSIRTSLALKLVDVSKQLTARGNVGPEEGDASLILRVFTLSMCVQFSRRSSMPAAMFLADLMALGQVTAALRLRAAVTSVVARLVELVAFDLRRVRPTVFALSLYCLSADPWLADRGQDGTNTWSRVPAAKRDGVDLGNDRVEGGSQGCSNEPRSAFVRLVSNPDQLRLHDQPREQLHLSRHLLRRRVISEIESSSIANETDAFNIPCTLLSILCHFSHSFLYSAVMTTPVVVSPTDVIAKPARTFLALTVPVDPGAMFTQLAGFRSASSPSAAFHLSASCKATSVAARQLA